MTDALLGMSAGMVCLLSAVLFATCTLFRSLRARAAQQAEEQTPTAVMELSGKTLPVSVQPIKVVHVVQNPDGNIAIAQADK